MTARTKPYRSMFLALALLATPGLTGCGSMIADMPVVGLPAGAPTRPADPGAYLPVHDVPTSQPDRQLSSAEVARLQAELAKARDRQAVPASTPKSTN